MGRIHIHWNYLVIRMGALLLALWFVLLCISYSLKFGRSRMFDCLTMLIFLDFHVGGSDVFIYNGQLLILMKNSILEIVFYAYYKELNCSRVRKVKLCLFGKVFECYDIIIKMILLYAQMIEDTYCMLLLSNIGEIGIESIYEVHL